MNRGAPEAAHATPARSLSPDQVAMAIEAGGVGTWHWDLRTGVVTWDAVLEHLFGLGRGEFEGTAEAWAARLHPEDREEVLAAVQRSTREGGDHRIDYRIVLPDGGVRWLHGRGRAVQDDSGAVVALQGVGVDVTERRRVEAERDRLLLAERTSRERLAFLAEASTLLARSLDAERTLHELAHLVVPRLADWCVVDVVEGAELRMVAVGHRDPEKVALARRYRREHPADEASLPGRVARTGEAVFVRDVDDQVLSRIARDPDHLEILRSLELSSIVAVPLVARGVTVGVLTLVYAESGRHFDTDDLAFAGDLARRAGIALDNARLYESRTQVARVLQNALLPPSLPDMPGVALAARHEPASELVVGGDFYDVFANPGGTWTVLIGDVCGKDTAAATQTALARHTARATALRDPAPEQILDMINGTFLGHGGDERFCTAVCLRLRPSETGVTVDAAVAGHPTPVRVDADGAITPLGLVGQPVGMFPEPEYQTTRLRLSPGDALVLYTDGVTEARRDGDLLGEEGVLAALETAGSGSPDQLADALVSAATEMEGPHRRDDLAVLALRATGKRM